MKIEMPEQRWGNCSTKPYHRTGEVNATDVFNRLAFDDASNLQTLLELLSRTAQTCDVKPHVILAGSAANLNSGSYHDIDMLVHVEPVEKRRGFATRVISVLEANNRLIVSSRGSFILLRQKLGNQYSIYYRYTDAQYNQTGVAFDVHFADAKDGTYEDILAFHRTNRLAFCELPLQG